jgi:hypothetical protein
MSEKISNKLISQQELDEIYSLLMATLDWVEYNHNNLNCYDHRNTVEKHRNTCSRYYKQKKYSSLLKYYKMLSHPYIVTFDTLFEAYILKRTGIKIHILDKFSDFELKIYEIVTKGKITSITRYEYAQKMINFILLNGHSDNTLVPTLRKLTNEYIEKVMKNFIKSFHLQVSFNLPP